ncbi:sensor histidine kinase [Actinomadura algeriensis]|uniref:histidine kinase n=1 Tax=Actinomadura algeriensis TaxID=1679523 RepID=A0ABR9JIX5_9ACTN|nr:histidine kinase [Actinomadura algeriensis]MBE1530414.1 signal transduction histidine kinase [Actinomadura algeriensis]
MGRSAWLAAPLVLVSGSLLLCRTRPLLALGLAAAAIAADAVVGPSLLPVPILAHLLHHATLRGPAGVVPWVTGGGYVACGLVALATLACTESVRLGVLTAMCASLLLVRPSVTGLMVRRQVERAEQAQRRIGVERSKLVMQERARVAGDIHDIVGNYLSAIALQSTAAMATAPRDNEKHLTALAEIRRSSLEGAGEIRRMVAALRADERNPRSAPAALDLARVLMERMEKLGSPARLRTLGAPVALHEDIETVACRIIQESLTNVLKHACRSAVDVTVAYKPDQVVITVENDMCAVDADLAFNGSGFGLAGMAERAVRVGGTCTARRRGDRWRVHAVLPSYPVGRSRSERSSPEESLS